MSDNVRKEDVTDNLIENQDLLDILGASTGDLSDLEKAMSSEDDTEATKKMEEIKALAANLDSVVSTSNPGSGDIDQDLMAWFNGDKNLPSDGLNSYVGNSMIKMDYGLSRHTLSNMTKMGVLGKFLDSSFDVLFDENAIMGLGPDELEERVKLAFTMYKELGSLNQRTVMSLKDYKMKTNSESDEVDKLSLLLSSIPGDKLKTLLLELNGK